MVIRTSDGCEICAVRQRRYPRIACRHQLRKRADPERPVIYDIEARSVGLGDCRNPFGDAVIGIINSIIIAVANAIVVGAEIGKHSVQAVAGVIAIARAGQCRCRRRCKICIAGRDLSEIIARPGILCPFSVGRCYLVQLIGHVGKSQFITIGILLFGNPPVIGSISRITFGNLGRTVFPGPDTSRKSKAVKGAIAFFADVSRFGRIPGIDDNRAVACLPLDRAAGCILRAGKAENTAISTHLPLVGVIAVGGVDYAVIGSRNGNIEASAEEQLVLLRDQQVAGCRIDRYPLVSASLRRVAKLSGTADNVAGTPCITRAQPCKYRSHYILRPRAPNIY